MDQDSVVAFSWHTFSWPFRGGCLCKYLAGKQTHGRNIRQGCTRRYTDGTNFSEGICEGVGDRLKNVPCYAFRKSEVKYFALLLSWGPPFSKRTCAKKKEAKENELSTMNGHKENQRLSLLKGTLNCIKNSRKCASAAFCCTIKFMQLLTRGFQQFCSPRYTDAATNFQARFATTTLHRDLLYSNTLLCFLCCSHPLGEYRSIPVASDIQQICPKRAKKRNLGGRTHYRLTINKASFTFVQRGRGISQIAGRTIQYFDGRRVCTYAVNYLRYRSTMIIPRTRKTGRGAALGKAETIISMGPSVSSILHADRYLLTLYVCDRVQSETSRDEGWHGFKYRFEVTFCARFCEKD